MTRGIELDDLILVLEIVEDGAVTIGSGKLRPAGKRDRGNDLVRCRIEHGDILAAAVECPHRLR